MHVEADNCIKGVEEPTAACCMWMQFSPDGGGQWEICG